jgi:aspartate aminotransferase
VIIPTPGWVTYPELVKLAGGTPIMIPTSAADNFELRPEALAAAISPRTKLLILNSPNNPTGAVYSAATLGQIADLVVQHDFYCLSDEIYEHIVYTRAHVSIAGINAEIQARTVVINGVSKAYAMTGWRIGYLAAAPAIARAIGSLQSQCTHHPATISQWAALEALNASQQSVGSMAAEFAQRRAYIYQALRQIPHIHTPEIAGAFYAFPQVDAYYGKKTPQGQVIANSMDLCTWLLEQHRLVLIPGLAFGADAHIRFSFATAMDKIEQGLAIFAQALSELQ